MANPHKTFPLALMLAVILVILMYVLPLLACLGVMTDTSDWKLGFFATVARQVGGQWLAWWMLAAAAVSHQEIVSMTHLERIKTVMAFLRHTTCRDASMKVSHLFFATPQVVIHVWVRAGQPDWAV